MRKIKLFDIASDIIRWKKDHRINWLSVIHYVRFWWREKKASLREWIHEARVKERVIKINYRHSRWRAFLCQNLAPAIFYVIFIFSEEFLSEHKKDESDGKKSGCSRRCFHCNKIRSMPAEGGEREVEVVDAQRLEIVHFFLIHEKLFCDIFSLASQFSQKKSKQPAELLAFVNECFIETVISFSLCERYLRWSRVLSTASQHETHSKCTSNWLNEITFNDVFCVAMGTESCFLWNLITLARFFFEMF